MNNYTFEVFDYYLWLVNFHSHSNEKAVYELNSLYQSLEIKKDFWEDVETPLEEEMKYNLVNTPSLEGKVSLLRYYLFEQRDLQYFFRNYESLTQNKTLFHEEYGIYIEDENNNNAKIEFTSEQVYAVRCMESVDSFLQILLRECEKYNLKYETIYEGFEIIPNGVFDSPKGRNFEYDIEKTKAWFEELIENKEFQKSNGKPLIKLIDIEIARRHERQPGGSKPALSTVKYQRLKLGLTGQ